MSEVEAASSNEALAAALLRLRAKEFITPALLTALGQTPRAHFVATMDVDYAYHNRVIPIACGEYIERLDEQMAIIAALGLEKNHRVLEIGTGSGFSSALIARLVARVITIERYKTLTERARTCFAALRLTNIILQHSDAHHGLPVHYGMFDRIIVWPACKAPPQIFIDRLAAGGMLIAPIGAAEQPQMMTKISKTGSRLNTTPLLPVRYQPMLSGCAQTL